MHSFQVFADSNFFVPLRTNETITFAKLHESRTSGWVSPRKINPVLIKVWYKDLDPPRSILLWLVGKVYMIKCRIGWVNGKLFLHYWGRNELMWWHLCYWVSDCQALHGNHVSFFHGLQLLTRRSQECRQWQMAPSCASSLSILGKANSGNSDVTVDPCQKWGS